MQTAHDTATIVYTNVSDAIREFITEECEWVKTSENGVFDIETKILSSDLYYQFREWCATKKVQPMTLNKFGMEMKKRYPDAHKRSNAGKVYIGLRIKQLV